MNATLGKILVALRTPFALKIYATLGVALVLLLLFDKVLMPFYVKGGGIVAVPDVSGKTFEEAERRLRDVGLYAKKGYEVSDNKRAAGIVLSQNPAPRSQVKEGRSVYLSVNAPRKTTAPLPDFKGRTLSDAKLTLERLGLKVGAIKETPATRKEDEGVILSQSPSAGTSVATESAVSFTIGKIPPDESGVQQGVVPDVGGKTLAEAEAMVVEAGFTVGEIFYRYSTSLVPNTVVAQTPRKNELAPLGKPIALTVSTNDKEKEKEKQEPVETDDN